MKEEVRGSRVEIREKSIDFLRMSRKVFASDPIFTYVPNEANDLNRRK